MRADAQRNRDRIVEVAREVFREQGYAETTVEQIAAAADVSPSTFFRYFPTKEETVLTDLFDREAFEYMIQAPAELGPLEALAYAVRATFGRLSEEEMQLEVTRNELIRNVPELRRGQLAEMTRPMRLLADASATRLGRPADDPDVKLFAGAVVGALMTIMAADELEAAELPAAVESLYDVMGRLDRVVRLPEL